MLYKNKKIKFLIFKQYWVLYTSHNSSLPLIFNMFLNFKTETFFNFNFKLLILSIQKIKRIINTLNVYNYAVLGTRNIYSKSIIKSNTLINFYKRGKYLGFLSNFCIVLKKFCYYSSFLLETRPDLVVSIAFHKNIVFLAEAKKNKIPLVGICNFKASLLVYDYPVIINSKFFYSMYFFSKLFISYLCN